MRAYNITCIIYQTKDITFKAESVEIHRRGNGIFCSLEGEFLQNTQSFEPRMRYRMSEMGVTTRDLAKILTPIYSALTDNKPKDIKK